MQDCGSCKHFLKLKTMKFSSGLSSLKRELNALKANFIG